MKKRILLLLIPVLTAMPVLAQGFPAVEVYQKTSKAVVLIVAQKDEKSSMAGAGSFITKSGYIITNAHVVIDKSTDSPYSQIRVFLKPDRVTGDFSQDLTDKHKAKVVVFDTNLDLAMLKVDDTPGDVRLIELANSEEIDVGEEVVAIGHPEQGGLWSLTYGRISGEIDNQSKVKGKNVFQTDTSVNRGNSGGPLLDRRGYMVGINTNIARLGADNLPITGVNFALRSAVVKNWLDGQGIMVAYGKQPLNAGEAQTVESKTAPASQAQTQAPAVSAPETRDNTKPKAEAKSEETSPAPVPDAPSKPAEMQAAPKNEKKHTAEPEKLAEVKPAPSQEERILTPKKPYTFDNLFQEVEKEMEDMMQDMRGEIDRTKESMDGNKGSRRNRRK